MKPATSNYRAISTVLDKIITLDPKSIIDIGGGSGKYAHLCREYLDNLENLVLVEPNLKFVGKLPTGLYNKVYVEGIQDFSFTERFDLALLIAVMGRLDYATGKKVLRNILENCTYLLITCEKEQHGGQTQWGYSQIQEAIGKKYFIKLTDGTIPYENLYLICLR